MLFAEALWWISLSLATGAIGVMLSLILWRAVRELRDPHRAARRDRIIYALVTGLDHGHLAPELITAARRRPFDFMAVADELRALVRGDAEANLDAMLAQADLVSAVTRYLQHPLVAYRRAAIAALQSQPGSAADIRLRKGLTDPHPAVRLAAVDALTRRASDISLAALVGSMPAGTTSASPIVRRIFTRLAGQRPEAMAQLLNAPGPAQRKVLILDGLGQAGILAHGEAVARCQDHADPEVRAATQRCLGELGWPIVTDTIAAGLADSHSIVRSNAATAAGKIGLTTLLPTLLSVLDDPDWWVRFRTGEAIRRLGTAGRAALHARASDEQSEGGRTAAAALLEAGTMPTEDPVAP